MSSDKGKPVKPFLGGDEISSELDAWDDMFDNLHDDASVVEPALAVALAVSGTPPATQPDQGQTFDDFAPNESIDDQLSLDQAVPSPPPPVSLADRFADWQDDEVDHAQEGEVDLAQDEEVEHVIEADEPELGSTPDESDFSDISENNARPPSLGDSGNLPMFADATRHEVRLSDDDDDEVYTSASRPNVGPSATAAPLPREAVVAPAKSAAVKRTGPAIIRRQTPVAVPNTAVSSSDSNDGAFGGTTRSAAAGELDARTEQSRRADARSRAPTAPPPMSFTPSEYAEPGPAPDDDYEIEIAASDEDAPPPLVVPEPAAAPQPRRTVAHVLRRETPAKGAPAAPPPRQVERPVEPARLEPARPASEDDFSDVAAAVGADDISMDELIPPSRAVSMRSSRPTSPPPGAPTPVDEAAIEDESELDALVDHMPTNMLRDGVGLDAGASDAYIPMAPPEDNLEVPLEGAEVAVPQFDDDGIRAPAATERPPGLMDLYPRVKRPTSVPVIGDPASLGELRPSAHPDTTPSTYSDDVSEIEPMIDLDAIGVDSQWPEQLQPLPSTVLEEDVARMLVILEREIPTVDEPTAAAGLRIEAARLSERIGDPERARAHYDAALLADPRATPALRGLRRIARSDGDLVEAMRHLDAEIAVAGALERRPLGHYRVDLLMASGDHDLARVAVGELLDAAPSDVRALLAQLELTFLDARADEFGRALEQLAHAVTDNELRAAVQQARALLAVKQSDHDGQRTWLAAAAESDPGSLAARFGAARDAAAGGRSDDAANVLLELATLVEGSDPGTAAAFALRAQHWATGETGARAAELAARALPADPLIARVAAESVIASSTAEATLAALTAWASCAAPRAERAYAAARAAELAPDQAATLWAQALQYDPDDDYASAQLRTAYVAADQMQRAIDVDLAAASSADRDRARLRAAFGMIAQDQLDASIGVLQQGHAEKPTSLAVGDALAEALAAAGRWSDRARLLAEIAVHPGVQLDPDVAQLRSALAWEEAVAAISSVEDTDPAELQRTTAAAIGAWERVIEQSRGAAPEAHAGAMVLASRIENRDLLEKALERAQAVEINPWGALSLALRRARLFAIDDPGRADAALSNVAPQLDDPRRVVVQLLAAARRGELGDAATILEERADRLRETSEAAGLRLRAAQLALDAGDAMRATSLMRLAEKGLPTVPIVSDLLSAARRRAGDASGPVRVARPGSGPVSPDEFARVVRDADDAAMRGDGVAALSLYQSALEMRPGDPLAVVPLIRVAYQQREPEPIAAIALAQLRAAETAGDGAAKAEAYELLSQIDRDLRHDAGSAQIALESASQADPTRVDLLHRLEREYTAADQIGELFRLRRSEVEQISADLRGDRAAMVMDTAVLAARDGRPDAELADLYREALAADPKRRLALLYLETIIRRAGASEELARLEDQIATYFDGDPRSQAAFFTRAGETLTELGQIDAAVQKFGKADGVLPGHTPALEGWRHAALKGQLWLDVAEAATRQASVGGEPHLRGALHHFAGVALMDKALIGDQAMAAFRRTLDADPSHRDAFLRLRILLEEEGSHDELAMLIAKRLEHEPPGAHKLGLHRALAQLGRNFLGDRDLAKSNYRAILAVDPNDLRAHAEVADIAWEQGAWQEAADALINRARLERDPEILKSLCYRLGLIYADYLIDVPMALKAFQRALTYNPDDEQTLVRLADLATQAGEWKLALGACERLVKMEQDPERRAQHLHRVARIFKMGFGDFKRAERALNLALDAAPASEAALAELVSFYREANDMTSVRVHLNRVAGTMRVRAANDPRDGVAYRVISRAMAARASVGVNGSFSIARAAAELSMLFGTDGEPERLLLAEPARIDLTPLLRSETDELLFPRGVPTELRQMFTLLGDRVAKHVGIGLHVYGVGRGDRLRARDSTAASHAQDIATGLGFGEIDVYLSPRMPYVMVVEPTSPASLVIGQALAQGDARVIRFAAGSALKLAHAHLAIPARLPADELGVLVVALLRLFQPEFPSSGLDEGAIATQIQKLKRLIPTGLASEMRPFAHAIDPRRFSHLELARDVRIAGLRAGLVCGGSLVAGLGILAQQSGTDIPGVLADPLAQGLVQFALGEDHATMSR